MKENIQKKKDISECTLLGIKGHKKIYVENNSKNIFICGTTGSGKTVVLENFINSGVSNQYPMLIMDGKGDIGEGSILQSLQKLKQHRKVYVINLTDPKNSDKYNPFKNANATMIKDMLINLTDWSEEHYKVNTERYLQRVIQLLLKVEDKLSLKTIVYYVSIDKFIELSSLLLKNDVITKQEHIDNIELSKISGKIAESAVARFSTILESEIGNIFSNNGIDIYEAIKENAIILFILNPLIYPELSPLLGRLFVIDSKKAVSNLFTTNKKRIFFIFDEMNVYASKVFLDLVNKSRSANVTNILATQSLSDLDEVSEAFREQVIENCNNYIVLRQNSSQNAEKWANIIGTRGTLEITYQLSQQGYNTNSTGLGSARRVREYLYHPDEIKSLKVGNGIYVNKDLSYHTKLKINKIGKGGNKNEVFKK
ncbi:type IV secretion system DNA-binding domain-containing protein [Thomasclavelia cocleata]|uniref:type IV secretory system conjugative DNA transfer family protein n=1 Tax=Thomasclavelia cocleata TaxID=69824 RepID=UPI00242E6568|nr:type IV secretion system DNA-binding domain-containing protein [Thomasclavelia cocleata]